jgi:hypothetical protein
MRTIAIEPAPIGKIEWLGCEHAEQEPLRQKDENTACELVGLLAEVAHSTHPWLDIRILLAAFDRLGITGCRANSGPSPD